MPPLLPLTVFERTAVPVKSPVATIPVEVPLITFPEVDVPNDSPVADERWAPKAPFPAPSMRLPVIVVAGIAPLAWIPATAFFERVNPAIRESCVGPTTIPLPAVLTTLLPGSCRSMPLTPGANTIPLARAPAADPSIDSGAAAVTAAALLTRSEASGDMPPTACANWIGPLPAASVRFFAPSTVPSKLIPVAVSVGVTASVPSPR